MLFARTLTLLVFAANLSAFAYNKALYGEYKVGKAYKVGNKTYYPKEYQSLQEEGYISWYGPGFHEKATANGASFNKNTYTAAHKTLQMPAVIEITNLENGKKVIAVVNDRGPFSESQSRILDVSERIANDMGFLGKGVTRGRIVFLKKETDILRSGGEVKLGLVKPSGKAIVAEPQKIPHKESKSDLIEVKGFKTNYDFGYLKGIYIQVGAFQNRENALKTLNSLQESGLELAKIRTERTSDGSNIDIVRVGPIENGREENILTKIKQLGYSNAGIVILK